MGMQSLNGLQQDDRIRVISRRRRTLSSLTTRWVILVLICVTMTCTYYSYDIPAALYQNLSDYMPPSDDFSVNFNMLYTFYSIPNVILPFFGGSYVDRIGASICFLLFASLTLLGQVVFTIGVAAKSWPVMITGRTIYGFGGENICVAQSSLIATWFAGKEVAFAMGIAVSISRLGSVLNNMVSPVVANDSSTKAACWLGVLLNMIGVGMSALLFSIEYRVRTKLRNDNMAVDILTQSLLEDERRQEEEDEHSYDGVETSSMDEESESVHVDTRSFASRSRMSKKNPVKEPPPPVKFSDVKRFGKLFWLLSLSCLVVYACVLPFNNVASAILLERNYFMEPNDDCILLYPDECTKGTMQNKSNPATDAQGHSCPTDSNYHPVLPTSINITDSSKASSQDWYETSYIFPTLTPQDVNCEDPFWDKACTVDYCNSQDDATETAGRMMSIPYLMSAFLAPPFGMLIDKIGYRAIIASLSPLILMMVHIALAKSHKSPVGPLIGQGLAYALYASAIWPSVPLTVESRLTGTAYGVITSVQNIGLALFPLLIAAIYAGADYEYIPSVEYFFVSCAVIGVAVGVALNYYDRSYGGKLNNPSKAAPAEDTSGSYDVSALAPLSNAEII